MGEQKTSDTAALSKAKSGRKVNGKERKKDDWDLWSLKRWVLPTSAKKRKHEKYGEW